MPGEGRSPNGPAEKEGARLRWAVRADDEPTASEGGDPSGTYKRWFGRASGRAGWWRGSRLVSTSYRPRYKRGMRAGLLPRVRSVQWMDAPMQLLRGLPWSVSNNARAGMAESAGTPPFSWALRPRVG